MSDVPKLRILNLLLAGPAESNNYSVSFEREAGLWRPLSVIAGESQTGKTSTIEFILYCLGAREFPQHSEIARAVRSASLDIVLDGSEARIERSAAMQPSSSAMLKFAGVDRREQLVVEPTSDPSSLSQRILSALELDGIALPVAPTQDASDVQTLGIRDLMRLFWLPNDRLDGKNLVMEHANYVVTRKFQQTVDAIFGVDDHEGATLAANLKLARRELKEAEGVARSILAVVQYEYPDGIMALQAEKDRLTDQIESVRQELAGADQNAQTHGNSVTQLKSRLRRAQETSTQSSLRVFNRRSLLERLNALRAQYIDDQKKLVFLGEADRLFDPLQITTCPACLSDLQGTPVIRENHCTLCGQHVGDPADDAYEPGSVQIELKALKRRLSELEAYIVRLKSDLIVLEESATTAADTVRETVTSLEAVAHLPAPFLALRDDLGKQLSTLLVRDNHIGTGLRFWATVTTAEEKVEALTGRVKRLSDERAAAEVRTDRAAVVRTLSSRFGQILQEMEYPKLSNPYLDDNLVPHVRGLPYTAASSGGQVLISLAWYLSLLEVSFETDARAPGLLIIDSPQKNLGHKAHVGDSDFGDSRLVEGFYEHVKKWLSGPGVGAQIIIVDNTPPASVADDVVVRFTRDPTVPPYGLITDAVD